MRYVGGFVARHSKKYTKDCPTCDKCLKKPVAEITDADMLISCKTKGGLIFPSDSLVLLLRTLEEKLLQTSLQAEMEENFIFVVLDKLEQIDIPQIGCESHSHELTKAVLKFFLIFRMHFLTKRWNEKVEEYRKKQKSYRKQAHLT